MHYIDSEGFEKYLYHQEKSKNTIEKYMRDLDVLKKFVGKCVSSKEQLTAFKNYLIRKGYAPASINSMLAAVNSYLSWCGQQEWRLKYVRYQQPLFIPKKRLLTKSDCECLIKTAYQKRKISLALAIQTIAATGIRVSELSAITVRALKKGYAQIYNKGKLRHIFLPKILCRMLLQYCKNNGIKTGQVFITKNGKAMNRSNFWKMLKSLSKHSCVSAEKVYPHSFRHLFARAYYQNYKDIVSLAAILGHSNIQTTSIYTKETDEIQKTRLNRLLKVNSCFTEQTFEYDISCQNNREGIT